MPKMTAQLLGGSADNHFMNQHNAIICRLRAARWRVEEAQATLDGIGAAGRGDKRARAAAEVWAELCALRVLAWKEEAERG